MKTLLAIILYILKAWKEEMDRYNSFIEKEE